MISKKLILLLVSLALNASHLFAKPDFQYETEKSPDGSYIVVEGYNPETIEKLAEYKPITAIVPGQFITIFRFNEFPKNKEIVCSLTSITKPDVNTNKPLVERGRFTILEDGQIRFKNKKYSSVSATYTWFNSLAYLPGERIVCKFSAVDGSFEYTSFFYPHPIIAKSKNGSLICHAELSDNTPITIYQLYLYGLKEGSQLLFTSRSEDEMITSTLEFKEGMAISYLPGVIGKMGGTSVVTFKTKDDNLRMVIPWGTALLPYIEKVTYYQDGPKEHPQPIQKKT